MSWPFGDLQMFGYGAIICDPPWNFRTYSSKGHKKSPQNHYATMSESQIRSLPVELLAGKDCLLWLWATWPMIDLALDVMAAWRFKYITGGAWVKRTKKGKLRMGTGYVLRTACEPFLIGRIGEPQARTTDILNVIDAQAREHSRKPPEARSIVERMTPEAFRVELFAREPWPGNTVWGRETDKFSEDGNVEVERKFLASGEAPNPGG